MGMVDNDAYDFTVLLHNNDFVRVPQRLWNSCRACRHIVGNTVFNIFNIRAEIGKYQATSVLEKKHEAYRAIVEILEKISL
jgi:hypothetical protein